MYVGTHTYIFFIVWSNHNYNPFAVTYTYIRMYVLVISCPGVLQQKYSAD